MFFLLQNCAADGSVEKQQIGGSREDVASGRNNRPLRASAACDVRPYFLLCFRGYCTRSVLKAMLQGCPLSWTDPISLFRNSMKPASQQ